MKPSRKRAGLVALLAVAGAAAIVWLVLEGGDGSTPAPSAVHVNSPAAGATPKEGFPVRRLPRQGNPLVWLKKGAEVELWTEPDGGQLVRRLHWRTRFGERTALAVFEHQGRWAGVPTPLLPNGRLGWVKLDARKLNSGETPYSVLVDLSDRRLALLRNDRIVRSFGVSVGAPGADTPTGRFATTDEFLNTLNAFAYGCCAIALTANQPRVPSGWLGGSRIAIHGTPGPIGAAVSHGCVRALDTNVRGLLDTIPLATPVVVRQ